MNILQIYASFIYTIWIISGGHLKSESNTWHIEQQRIIGDLFASSNIGTHSLSWTIELAPFCYIDNIISHGINSSNIVIEGHKCSQDDLRLHLSKTLYLPNAFVVFHPYYRLYRKFRRKRKDSYRKLVLTNASYIYQNNKYDSFNHDSHFFNDQQRDYRIAKGCIEAILEKIHCVHYFQQEIFRKREKRHTIQFADPLFKDQWHLKNDMYGEYDINVMGAWESGITGRGITVCVIDDGLQWSHPDLRDNYNPRGSYDLNADDVDPSPVRNGERNEHGTRCAGEIAAVANSVCGVGIAYRANISGVRVLGKKMTDSMEAAAFVQGLQINDIYSCSWGPNDDGKTVDGPHRLAKKALIHGVTYGRKGYGAIYVVASGNGGKNKDNCNFDGYANSVYTVTMGAVDSKGRMPYYAEECATMLAVAPSSGNNGRAIVTTDWQGSSNTGCTWQHSGTSAAAPMAAAIIALALEMQPCLSWRDVQYLIVLTSKKIDRKNTDWITNEAGLAHSHQHGFGLMDATHLVSVAAVWESVPFATKVVSALMTVNAKITDNAMSVANYTITKELADSYGMNILESVQVYITLSHEYRGTLRMSLICPSGTKSLLASPRLKDNSTRGFHNWPLGTVRCWGEKPNGLYSLQIENTDGKKRKGSLMSWRIVLYGTTLTPELFQDRRRLVERVKTGELVSVNRSKLCHPPESHFSPVLQISERWSKILTVLGCFLLFMTIYNTLEYLLCYNESKENFSQYVKSLSRMRRLERTSRLNQSLQSVRWQTPHGTDAEAGSVELSPLVVIHSVSPTGSCEADVSSFNEGSDDDYRFLSGDTSDTVVPRESDNTTELTTDLTTDHNSETECHQAVR